MSSIDNASSANRRIDIIKQQIEDGATAFRAGRDKAKESHFAPRGKFTNWSNIGHCNPEVHHRPEDEAEVVAILRQINAAYGGSVSDTANKKRQQQPSPSDVLASLAAAPSSDPSNAQAANNNKRKTLRIAGAGSSTNAMCFTNSVMLHMKEHFNRVIEVNHARCTITVQGGCTLKHLYSTLDDANLMLPCVPACLDATIAGCIGTSTHGSGINTRPLHSFVQSLKVVTAAGDVKVISKEASPTEWRHWTCHLGLLGAVLEVTLQAERKVLWRRISAPVPIHGIYSVLQRRLEENAYYRFWWTPHTEECFETTIRPVAAVDETGMEEARNNMNSSEKVPNELDAPGAHVSGNPSLRVGDTSITKDTVGAIAAALRDPHSSHHLWDKHQSEQQLITDTAKSLLPEPVNLPVVIQHAVLERALHAATFTPALQPAVNQAYQKAYLASTQEAYGSCAEVMRYDCLFRQHRAEWAVDVSRALEAFDAVRRVIVNNNLKVHFPVEFTFSDADDSTLSLSNGRRTCYITAIMYRPLGREAPDTAKFLELFSREMFSLGGRSHWGAYCSNQFKNTPSSSGRGGAPLAVEWAAFDAYRKQCDPNDVMVNDWFKDLTA